MTIGERLELVRKFLFILGPLALAFWTVVEFSASASFVAKKPFLERQLNLCFEAAATVSTLATTTDSGVRKKARIRFFELFWGELVLVENTAVAGAMIDFRDKLLNLDGPELAENDARSQATATSAPKRNVASVDASTADLKTLSLSIATNCRELIGESWDVSLITLPKNLFE